MCGAVNEYCFYCVEMMINLVWSYAVQRCGLPLGRWELTVTVIWGKRPVLLREKTETQNGDRKFVLVLVRLVFEITIRYCG